MRTAVPLWESSWSAACGSSSPSYAKLSCIRPRTHSLTCRPEGFSLGGNPLLFPPEKSGSEQRRTRPARANSDWENRLGTTGLVLKTFQACLRHSRPHLCSTHCPGLHRRFHGKDLREPVAVRGLGRRLDWRHVERDRNHTNGLTRQHNRQDRRAMAFSVSKFGRCGEIRSEMCTIEGRAS